MMDNYHDALIEDSLTAKCGHWVECTEVCETCGHCQECCFCGLEMRWYQVSEAAPPNGFVLVWAGFDDPGSTPKMLMAYFSPDLGGRWRTHWGKLEGTVTHWHPLPVPPAEDVDDA